jgi:hypothetical protein
LVRQAAFGQDGDRKNYQGEKKTLHARMLNESISISND